MRPWSAPPITNQAPSARPGTPPLALAGLLRTHAAGLLADTAAVDLLIGHRYWLARPVFTARFIHPVSAAGRPGGSTEPTGAYIDWPGAITALGRGELSCSGSEADMLRIAASLGAEVPVTLREVLGCLDATNIAAVATAITAANGTQ
jgi:hypothetical protein